MGFEVTRSARIQPSVAPLRSVEGTRVSALRPRLVTPERLFAEKQRMMASAVRE